jgi:hypothetical protein
MKKTGKGPENGFLIYKLEEQYICTLIETAPDSWEIVCTAGKRRIGSYLKAKKLTDEFVALYSKCCGGKSDPGQKEQILNNRFAEFLEYRMVG